MAAQWIDLAPQAPSVSSEQARVDAIQAEARAAMARDFAPAERRPLFRPPPPPLADLAPTTDRHLLRLAEEVAYVRRLIEATGDEFSADPAVLHRHGRAMQSFDLVTQILGHVAKVLETENKAAAIDRIGMQEMKARLKRQSL